jgi:hypothetical protein
VPVLAQEDLETNLQNLKDAVAKKDVDTVKKLAVETSAAAKKQLEAQPPSDPGEKENWQKHLEYVRDVQLFCEYSLFATGIQGTPAQTVELIGLLENMNPKSKYLEDAYARYFVALNSTGQGAKIPAIAEKALASQPDNLDLLLISTDGALSRGQWDRAGTLGRRMITAAQKNTKPPEGVPEAEYEKKRTQAINHGHYAVGMSAAARNQYAEADRELRAALPSLQGNNGLLGPALFQLGVANYNLGKMTLNKGKMLDAVKFSQQSAAIQGPVQQQAYRNAMLIQQEADKMR